MVVLRGYNEAENFLLPSDVAVTELEHTLPRYSQTCDGASMLQIKERAKSICRVAIPS